MTQPTRRYGWNSQRPDFRDFQFTRILKLPPAVAELRQHFEPVWDQGQLGSCTGHGVGGVFEYMLRKEGLTDFQPSRLQIYYDERALEGTTQSDSGASIRDGIKVIAKNGVAPETLWPYTIAKFAVKPPAAVYAAALRNKALRYESVANTSLFAIQSAIAAGLPAGHPGRPRAADPTRPTARPAFQPA